MALAASITLSGCEEETLTSQTPKTEIERTVTLNPRTAALNPQRTAPNLQRAAPNRRRTALNQQSAVENKQTAPTPTPRPRIASDEKAVDVVEGASEADERAADVGDQQPDVDQQAPIADPFANANPILDDYEFNGTVLAARRWHGLLWAWRRISWWTGLIFLSRSDLPLPRGHRLGQARRRPLALRCLSDSNSRISRAGRHSYHQRQVRHPVCHRIHVLVGRRAFAGSFRGD